MAQVGPEMAQDGSKMIPLWPQDAPTMLQDSSKTPLPCWAARGFEYTVVIYIKMDVG